jgi:hypothetical protein
LDYHFSYTLLGNGGPIGRRPRLLDQNTIVFLRGCIKNAYAATGSNSQPTRSRFSVIFLGPTANAELVPKFHVALRASNAALEW